MSRTASRGRVPREDDRNGEHRRSASRGQRETNGNVRLRRAEDDDAHYNSERRRSSRRRGGDNDRWDEEDAKFDRRETRSNGDRKRDSKANGRVSKYKEPSNDDDDEEKDHKSLRSERSTGRDGKEKKGARSASDMYLEYLKEEISLLQHRKDILNDYLDQASGVGGKDSILTGVKPSLLLELPAARLPKAKKSPRRVALILDRENNSTTFFTRSTVRLPSWLDVYLVWNPKSKNRLDLPEQVLQAMTVYEAETNVLKAVTTLCGIVARQYITARKGTEICLVYNCGDAARMKRYEEVANLFGSLGYEYRQFDGQAKNFADFLVENGDDTHEFTFDKPKALGNQ
ncbi:hypothetical protein DIPPA_17908 [Diplonema papillatum]|nr:hypothetical protein DIPPA_17908 [Diplonema papillatum]